MQITPTELKKLKEKCHECIIEGTDMRLLPCGTCDNSGKATIEIDKEWVECPNTMHNMGLDLKCINCLGRTKTPNKIPKYKIGDDIEIIEDEIVTFKLGRIENLTEEQRQKVENIGDKKEGLLITEFYANKKIKLKIISETEDKWRVIENGNSY